MHRAQGQMQRQADTGETGQVSVKKLYIGRPCATQTSRQFYTVPLTAITPVYATAFSREGVVVEVMRLDGIVCIFGTDDSTSGAAANIHGASADNENKDLRWQTRALCQVLTDEPGKSVVGDNVEGQEDTSAGSLLKQRSLDDMISSLRIFFGKDRSKTSFYYAHIGCFQFSGLFIELQMRFSNCSNCCLMVA
jgi:hypothetical protein